MHRIGQRREVHVQRVVIANTVEERILEIQAQKTSVADGCLGEAKAQKSDHSE